MAATIEIVSVGCDLYEEAGRAARSLSECQPDFEFRLPKMARRDALIAFRFEHYATHETLDRLKQYIAEQNAPESVGTIGLVRGSLDHNAFAIGNVRENPFCSVVTTHAYDRYTPSLHVFLCFYFVRWAIKFLCPDLPTHDPSRGCLFDARRDKRELIEGLESPKLCDDCVRTLQPVMNAGLRIQSIDALLGTISKENEATRVSALILKGGGVRGAALAGAVSVLMGESYSRFYAPRTFVGTSAGAIVAAFLAAGLSATQLSKHLQRDFSQLLDSFLRWPWNLLRGAGLHSGKPIEEWVEATMRSGTLKLSGPPEDPVRFTDIRASNRRLVVYAANRYGTLSLDSADESARPVARAVRFSMSIPLFFTTLDHDGDEVFDGGLLNNYPVEAFRRNEIDNQSEFVAIYLSSGRRQRRRPALMLQRILSILLNRDEAVVVRQFRRATIVVDCSPIGAVDFGLSDAAKRLLENRGRLAALNFVVERGWESSDRIEAELGKLEGLIKGDFKLVDQELKRKRSRRMIVGGLLLVALVLVLTLGVSR